MFTSTIRLRALRWCYTGQFATTIFSATKRCNVGTMLQPFETILQQCCNAVLRQKSSLRIVPCNITFNNDNGNGSENVTVKVNSCFSKFCRVYSNFPENFKCRPVFLDLNFWGPYSTLKREKNSSWLVCVLHNGDVTRDDSQQRF